MHLKHEKFAKDIYEELNEDSLVIAHIHTPNNYWSWFVMSIDKVNKDLCYGLIRGPGELN